MEMRSRMLAVIPAHVEPGPNANGCGTPLRNGEASSCRLDMGIVHNLITHPVKTFRRIEEEGERTNVVLLASEIAQLQAPS